MFDKNESSVGAGPAGGDGFRLPQLIATISGKINLKNCECLTGMNLLQELLLHGNKP
jgi:hypothetical protein